MQGRTDNVIGGNNMFKNMSANSRKDVETPSVNLIGDGTVIEGDMSTTGDIRVDGTIKGSLKVDGKLVLGLSGTIEGDVSCQNGDVSGAVHGKITVAELLSLKSSAKLTGDIFTSKIAIEPGATFTGQCNMGGVIKDIHEADRSEEQEFSEKTA